jgi:predicted phosphodiesterase
MVNIAMGSGATRLCVISDIHGNAAALDAVSGAVRDCAPDAVLVAGDLVAHGPRPAEALDALRALPAVIMIRGNTDRYLTEAGSAPAWPNDADERRASLQWTRDQLGEERLAFIGALPETASLDRCLLVHGSPGDDERGVFPETPVDRFDGPGWTAVLVCGHTHVPVQRRIGERLVVNAGSAAWPLDGDVRPSFAVLDRATDDDAWRAELRRVDYARERTLADLEDRRVPWRHAVRTFITTARSGRQGAREL